MYGGLNVENRQFSPHLSYLGWNVGCSLWSSSVMLGSVERRKLRLSIREIIFVEFQCVLVLVLVGWWTGSWSACIVHIFTTIAVVGVLEAVDGFCVHNICRESIPSVDHSLTEEKFSRIQSWSVFNQFLTREATRSAVLPWQVVRPSVCPSVCPSVRLWRWGIVII